MTRDRLPGLLNTLDDLFELMEGSSADMLKKLEAFKQECERYGVYTDDKSLARLRWDLRQAKLREGKS